MEKPYSVPETLNKGGVRSKIGRSLMGLGVISSVATAAYMANKSSSNQEVTTEPIPSESNVRLESEYLSGATFLLSIDVPTGTKATIKGINGLQAMENFIEYGPGTTSVGFIVTGNAGSKLSIDVDFEDKNGISTQTVQADIF